MRISPSLFLSLIRKVKIVMPEHQEPRHLTDYKSNHQYARFTSKLRLAIETYSNHEKTSLDKDKYFCEIYVTAPQVNKGPGHISASLIKLTDAGPEIATHTSYMPGNLSLLNGVSLGAVSVPAKNFPDIRTDDIQHADKIIRFPLNKAAFIAGVTKQQEMDRLIESGTHMYAITGKWNPIACFMTALYSAYRGSEISFKEYNKEYGSSPVEDHLGILVLKDEHHPDQFTHSELFNCTSAVQSVMAAMGMKFIEDYVLPCSLSNYILSQPGAKVVTYSLVDVKPEDLQHIDNLDENVPPNLQ